MRFHSGQHLVTAIFEREYNIDTISWNLGPDVSYIEFNVKTNVTPEQIARVESVCNELIADANPVHVHILNTEHQNDVSDEVKVVSKQFFFIYFSNFYRNFYCQSKSDLNKYTSLESANNSITILNE